MAIGSGNERTRYLVIHNNGAVLLDWSTTERSDLDIMHFNKNENKYLSDLVGTSPDIPFSIIVDYFDEDFRQNTITHVRGTDRKAILERKSKSYYRSTPFRYSRVTGREESGRRDDRAVFSALTQADVVNVWVDAILNNRGQIISITSAPYLSECWIDTFVKQGIEAKSNFLLLSYDWFSGLRTTFLKNGVVIFSRQTQRDIHDLSELVSLVKDQAVQTRRYLESTKLISYDDHLTCVLFHTQPEFIDLSAELSPKTKLQGFYDGPVGNIEGGRSVFLSQFIPSTIHRFKLDVSRYNRYASQDTTRYYWIARIRKSLYISSACIVVIGFLASLQPAFYAFKNYDLAQQLEMKIGPLTVEYEMLRKDFPETPIGSSIMEALVETNSRLSSSSLVGLKMVERLSHVLSNRPDVALRSIGWQLQTQHSADASTQEDNPNGSAVLDAIIDDQFSFFLTVDAEVVNPANLLNANEKLLSFIDDLSQDAGLEATVNEFPVDVDPDTTVSVELDGRELTSVFSLTITDQ